MGALATAFYPRRLEGYVAEYVSTGEGLAAAVEKLMCEPRVAMDIESDSFYRYPEHVCLVQLAGSGAQYLVDALAFEDASALGRLVEELKVEKVLHSADYDLRSLDRQWGFHLACLYDTSIAAHFVGLPRLGLDSVLKDVLGIEVAKGKDLQRADWSARPLSQPLLDYAAADVAHLLSLRDALDEQLGKLGRREWVAEECARLEQVRYAAPEPPEQAVFSFPGGGRLDGRALAVLLEMVKLREDEARRRGRPPFYVISNQALLHLAQHPGSDLDGVPGLGETVIRRLGQRLRSAVRRGMEAAPLRRPRREPYEPLNETQARRLAKLKQWRIQQGEALRLDPALIWPQPSLIRLARDPDSSEQELASPEVRRWQRTEFADSLLEALSQS